MGVGVGDGVEVGGGVRVGVAGVVGEGVAVGNGVAVSVGFAVGAAGGWGLQAARRINTKRLTRQNIRNFICIRSHNMFETCVSKILLEIILKRLQAYYVMSSQLILESIYAQGEIMNYFLLDDFH